MGYSTFDSRIKSSLDIAKDENITIDIIEDEGESIGQHPNCAYIKANTKDGRYIEVRYFYWWRYNQTKRYQCKWFKCGTESWASNVSYRWKYE